MFKTILQKEINNRQHDLEYIRLKALSEIRLFPDEGECISYRGGKGNGILKEVKKENGVIYERNNPTEPWMVADINKYWLKLKEILDIDKIINK